MAVRRASNRGRGGNASFWERRTGDRALGVQLRKAHARSKAKANGKGKAIAKK